VLQGQVSSTTTADAVSAEAARCREHLSSVQLQLQAGQKQLESADAALAAKRSAVAEAEEQLAAIKRDVCVCEPRLASLRQQLQELEANIRTREAEHQVRRGHFGTCGSWALLLWYCHIAQAVVQVWSLATCSPVQGKVDQ
jgi:chromosome segregation ATPase